MVEELELWVFDDEEEVVVVVNEVLVVLGFRFSG